MTVDHLIAQSTPHPPAALAGTLVGSAAVPDAVAALPLRLTCLSRTAGLVHLHASARDHTAEQSGFVRAARRIIRLVLEEALAVRRHEPHLVRTPLGRPSPAPLPVRLSSRRSRYRVPATRWSTSCGRSSRTPDSARS